MQIQENIPLQQYNTFHIAATARRFAQVASAEDLRELKDIKPGPMLVLGGGSNLLLTRDYDGLVLKNNIRGIELFPLAEEEVIVKAGAGENWHELVQYCIGKQLGGLENLSLIPGNTGASPMQNIGAYGVEIKDVFHQLEAYDQLEHCFRIFNHQECEFGYRESVFKRKYRGRFVITSVSFRLSLKPRFNISYGAIGQELERMGVKDLSLRAVSQAVINIRRSKLPDPAVIGNAGSFFKNPVISSEQFQELVSNYPDIPNYPAENGRKLAAGWLIEQCGWKGVRRGDAGCHDRQALVLVNYGSATGKEIFDLSQEILDSVFQKFGVPLEREVNII